MRQLKIIHNPGDNYKTEVFVGDEKIGLIQEIHITAKYPFVEISMIDTMRTNSEFSENLRLANEKYIGLLEKAGVSVKRISLVT